MGNLHHRVLVLLFAPAPIGDRHPPPPPGRCTAPYVLSTPPTHLRVGASSLHNPRWVRDMEHGSGSQVPWHASRRANSSPLWGGHMKTED